MNKVRTYIRADGALMAVCPNELYDVNVWVYCQTCDRQCELAGKTPKEIERGEKA